MARKVKKNIQWIKRAARSKDIVPPPKPAKDAKEPESLEPTEAEDTGKTEEGEPQ